MSICQMHFSGKEKLLRPFQVCIEALINQEMDRKNASTVEAPNQSLSNFREWLASDDQETNESEPLRNISFSGFGLTAFPEFVLDNLEQLQRLELTFNHLTDIRPICDECSRLVTLNLR